MTQEAGRSCPSRGEIFSDRNLLYFHMVLIRFRFPNKARLKRLEVAALSLFPLRVNLAETLAGLRRTVTIWKW